LSEAIVAAGVAYRVTPLAGDALTFNFHSIEPFDLAIVTDFVSESLLRTVLKALNGSGHVIFETFSGRGGNWEDLPSAGSVASCFEGTCELLHYEEHTVGPDGADAVTVKCFAKKY